MIRQPRLKVPDHILNFGKNLIFKQVQKTSDKLTTIFLKSDLLDLNSIGRDFQVNPKKSNLSVM